VISVGDSGVRSKSVGRFVESLDVEESATPGTEIRLIQIMAC